MARLPSGDVNKIQFPGNCTNLVGHLAAVLLLVNFRSCPSLFQGYISVRFVLLRQKITNCEL